MSHGAGQESYSFSSILLFDFLRTMLTVFCNPQNVPVHKTHPTAASKPCRRIKLPTREVWGSQQSNLSLEPGSPISSLAFNLMLPLKLSCRVELSQVLSTSGFPSTFTEALSVETIPRSPTVELNSTGMDKLVPQAHSNHSSLCSSLQISTQSTE